jgi:hypothetical protein
MEKGGKTYQFQEENGMEWAAALNSLHLFLYLGSDIFIFQDF